MKIDTSLRGVVEFAKQNRDLIQMIGNTAKDAKSVITGLADELDDLRQQATELVPDLKKQEFHVASDPQIKQQQLDILQKIADTQKDIQRNINAPILTTPMYADLAGYYVQLSNTYDNTIARFVTFSDAETDELNGLLKQATLDAIARQRWADVLAATVKLSELALKVAIKVAAA